MSENHRTGFSWARLRMIRAGGPASVWRVPALLLLAGMGISANPSVILLGQIPPSVPVFIPPDPPLRPVVAHRGNSSEAPENTLAAIRAAEGLAHMTEFDVHATADGKLILMHDFTLNRTTNGTGDVATRNYVGDLDQLDAGSWFSAAFVGEPVPTMEEAIVLALSLGLTPVVERKAGSAAAFYAELNALDALDKVHVISFDWGFLAQFRQLSPRTAIGALDWGDLNQTRINSAHSFGANYIDWSQSTLTQTSLDLARAAGLPLMVWTVNDVTRAQELLELGVVSITTDMPRTVSAVFPDFADWSEDAGQGLSDGDRGFFMDPDSDGQPNGIELILGTPPSEAGAGIHEMSLHADGRFYFSHTRRSRPVWDVWGRYQWSADLQTWHENGETSAEGVRVVMQPFVLAKGSAPEPDEVTVRVSMTQGAAERLFFRLEAVR